MRKSLVLLVVLLLAYSALGQKVIKPPKPPKPTPPPVVAPPSLPGGVCGRSETDQYAAVFYGRGADPSRPAQAFLLVYAATLGSDPADRIFTSFEIGEEDVRRYVSDGYTFLVINGRRLVFNQYVGYPVATVEVVYRFPGAWPDGIPEGVTGTVEVRYLTDQMRGHADVPGNPVREKRDIRFTGTAQINARGCY